jgi:methionyl aminopeptidase
VGEISKEKELLLNTTKKALDIGISKAVAGNLVYDISQAIQEYVESKGYSIVRELVGHGIGKQLHLDPQVPNFCEPNVITSPTLNSVVNNVPELESSARAPLD